MWAALQTFTPGDTRGFKVVRNSVPLDLKVYIGSRHVPRGELLRARAALKRAQERGLPLPPKPEPILSMLPAHEPYSGGSSSASTTASSTTASAGAAGHHRRSSHSA